MLLSIPQPNDYDVSLHHGFLPSEIPLEKLPSSYYIKWEAIVKNLQGLILSRRLRGVVEALPILSTDYLQSEPEWRRAYSVLGFIAHAYIWGGDSPVERVPPSISVPFLATCHHLELPPVATYAGVCLWNWKPLFDDEPIDNLENLTTLQTFTGSIDESWFYLVSVAIEARGAPIIPLMLSAIAAARRNDALTVTECLRSFAERLDELGSLLERMYDSCDPHVFYHRIRPFLAGSKNMADAGLPNGVIFDNGTGESQQYVQFSGGSNAQSSIIQFFDLVLGIEHRPTGTQPPPQEPKDSSEHESSAPPAPSHNFILDMRRYMPGPHARFLAHVAAVANIRPFVEARPANRALTTAFDACLAMLRAFRDKHIQMVSRYIIVKSRESRSLSRGAPPSSSPSSSLRHPTTNPSKLSPHAPLPHRHRPSITDSAIPTDAPEDPVPAPPVQHASPPRRRNLRGTGGTALIPFLKQARDETGEPAIDAWARRLLHNGPGTAASQRSLWNGEALGAAEGRGAGGFPVAKLGSVTERGGEMEIVGLAGTWSVDDSEGGICHW
ncbi:MAG: hypothetical protein M1821_006490 [Bathelium mastoideum]|nr:MAG: hypothetical protein M1821_006490 [Bathelium mastoideum]